MRFQLHIFHTASDISVTNTESLIDKALLCPRVKYNSSCTPAVVGNLTADLVIYILLEELVTWLVPGPCPWRTIGTRIRRVDPCTSPRDCGQPDQDNQIPDLSKHLS
jgi:hypothetical protein